MNTPMESALAVRPAPDQGRAVFTNAVALWQPIWARGVFGGAIVGQALAAAQHTVSSRFMAHSVQCTFLAAGNNETRLFYEVQALRSGRSIATRLVRVWQTENCIATVVVSFVHANMISGEARVTLRHQPRVPPAVASARELPSKGQEDDRSLLTNTCLAGDGCPMQCVRIPFVPTPAENQDPHLGPEAQRLHTWIRARGRIENRPTHLAALAYMTDSYFLGTVQRVHHANRFNNRPAVQAVLASFANGTAGRDGVSRSQASQFFEDLAQEEEEENARFDPPGSGPQAIEDRPNVETMVSLSHTIYFHNQRAVRADDWLLAEMDTPWAGDDRGLVQQRIWNQDGLLVATCVQEGLVRMRQHFPRSRL